MAPARCCFYLYSTYVYVYTNLNWSVALSACPNVLVSHKCQSGDRISKFGQKVKVNGHQFLLQNTQAFGVEILGLGPYLLVGQASMQTMYLPCGNLRGNSLLCLLNCIVRLVDKILCSVNLFWCDNTCSNYSKGNASKWGIQRLMWFLQVEQKLKHAMRPLPKSVLRRIRELAKIHPYPRFTPGGRYIRRKKN